MKLIALRFQGVGPYKGEYAIDFAALTRSHMFLIDGETGAGKTTLLDCVTFALYGSISGNTEGKSGVGDRNRLRSRFLDGQDVETYVELIFEEGGHYYAVRRTPAYEKPKARGEGMTSKNATGKMMRVADGAETGFAMLVAQAGEGDATDIGGTANVGGSNGAARYFDFLDEPDHAVAITSRAGEVAVEVERLLGLDRGQFSKTIMLAQGQFAQFLRMSPEDRTDLVKELFGAEEYEAIQNELDARRKRFGSAVDEQRATLEEHVRTAREN
ncbi:SMC family ATPase, partial [Bifidobacterium sp. UBA6881]